MVEVLVAIALVGIGIASIVAALTKLNVFASTSRNSTGAYSVVMSQIDRIQSATSIPQDAPSGILIKAANLVVAPGPPGLTESLPVLMNGTQTLTQLTEVTDPRVLNVYQDPDPTGAPILAESLTTTVTPVVVGGVTTYSATVTVQYKYQGRDYSFSMSTLRASDQ